MKRMIDNNKFALCYAWKYAKVFCVVCIFSIAFEVFGDYVGMNLGKWIFDGVSKIDVKEISKLVIFVACISVMFNIIQGIIDNYIVQFEKTDLLYSMTEELINSSFETEQKKMENPEFYDKFNRALGEARSRVLSVVASFRGIVYGVCSLIMVIYLAISIDLIITLSLIMASIINTIVSYISNNTEFERYMDNSKNERMLGYFIRLIYMPEYSKSIRIDKLGLKGLMLHKLYKNKDDVKENIRKFYNKFFMLGIINEISEFLFLRIIPWLLCIKSLYGGDISVGNASVVLSAITILPGVFSMLFDSIISISKNSLYIENYREVIDSKSKDIKRIVEDKNVGIEINDVSFSYPSGMEKYALFKVNLNINDGETVALVGKNGAGKTTLAMILAGIYKAQEGKVIYKSNENILGESKDLKVSYMGQESKLYSFSVAENILMRKVSSYSDYVVVEEALKLVGLYDKVMNAKYQMDSVVTREFDEDGIDFSAGERQRLLLARVYVSDAYLIILDEPTSNLDVENEYEIVNLMRSLFEKMKKTVVIISHNLSITEYADKICYMEDGKIVSVGNHSLLLNNCQGYSQLYEMQNGLGN